MPRDPRVVKLQQLRTERLTRASGAYYGTRTTAYATMPKGPRRRNGGRTALSMLLFVAILAIALYVGGQYLLTGYYSLGSNQATQANGGAVTVVVPEGESSTDLSDMLQNKGLIPNSFLFRMYLRFNNISYKAGQYTFRQGMTMPEVGQALAAGPPAVATVTVRIHEGWRAEQVAQALAEAHVASYQDVMREVMRGNFNYPFLADRRIGAPLEGYLFPDTYLFVKNSGARAALNIMLRNFGQRVSPQLVAEGKRTYGSFFKAIIVASMVERETGTKHDAYLIASVINNRLHDTTNQYPTLGVDATVQYAAGHAPNWWQDPTTEIDSVDRSPFNTRKHPGLPPWPISEPSLNSIEAAVNPPSTSYFSYQHFNGSHGMSVFCTFQEGTTCPQEAPQ